ncbi:MAG: Fe-S cluster assembly protein SufD [Paraprevotella sp.]|nr:Fe-S cluster assembly protein SufD [Paraprevotella sp.]MDY3098920.1 Fe-S cluster assembly protein SufD [Bacteroidaceae bacterium]MCI7142654.1 Fe-S cluster assembly protein SufD [Paraprevotella sp.]MDD5971805.1 Fe-S cluster assembly protein SufD [Paraprevotella sp.]MDD6823434.1 Fe-S cluster assembly protein SufD [Paraprevotella sp.]
MSAEKQYIDFYREASGMISSRSCPVMNAAREVAFQTFCAQGFPSRKVERYRYTDVQSDFAPNYGISLAPLQLDDMPFCSTLSQADERLSALYGQVADAADPIVSLNTMLSVDTLLIHIPRGAHPQHPIQISHLLKGAVDNVMVNRRVLIVLDECAQADIVITERSYDQRHFLTNQVIEVVCADDSILNLYEIEETHLLCTRYSSLFVRQGRNSRVSHTSLTLFNGHTRNRVDVRLQGEGSEVMLNGCVIADKMQRVDNNTLIDHQVGHCTSRQLYKYVLDDSAVGAFAGRILVREGAQKTVSQETNANLCSARTARMYTQPMLEIYADDVKCSHGSTVGQMDDAALFYMQQRGISEPEARLLLKSAFITEVIEAIPMETLRDRLQVLVDKRLRGELSKCEGCKLCK